MQKNASKTQIRHLALSLGGQPRSGRGSPPLYTLRLKTLNTILEINYHDWTRENTFIFKWRIG